QQGNTSITDREVVFDGNRYNLADITSASLVGPTLKPEYGYVLTALGIILLVAGYLIWGVFLTPMLAGAVLIVVGIALTLLVRRKFTVNLNRGEQQIAAVAFPNRRQAEQFLTAIKQAQASTPRQTASAR
ncbi:MAG TPA: DUF6232 family protein, partial [Roseiflexaceae bacterium]|nr:DUF6232 family protein [Roseiflexaceae bacterium]